MTAPSEAGRTRTGKDPQRRRPPATPAEPEPWNLYLEMVPGEACMAHVAELPGCFLLAADDETALEALPEAVRRHRAWRDGHGLPRVGGDDYGAVVRQAVVGPRPWSPNGAGALFSLDRRLLNDQEFDHHLRVLACARADLLQAVHAIPRGAFDEPTPGQRRTVRGTLQHLAETETWLMSRLGRRIDVPEPDPLRRVVDVRSCTLEHLLRYDRADRDLIFIPTERPSEDPEEMWSLRKCLRRLIEHELEHLEELQVGALHWSEGTGQD